MFGNRVGIAAGLVDDQHARLGAGLDIDGIKTRAVGGDDQKIRRALQERVMDMEVRRQLVACGADAILAATRRAQVTVEGIQP